jgi:transcription elongation factor Elf1
MSMWIDQKYIGTLSVRLNKFKRKDNYLYNFRCPICGDSQTNQNKARGYLFAQKGAMFYKCHNCNASMSLGNLIKAVDSTLYKEYCLDRYKAGETGRKAHKDHGFVFKPVKFSSNRENNFKGILTSLTKLNDDHEAIVYVKSRKIPTEHYEKLFYVEDISLMKVFSPEYEDKLTTHEPRLVIPFYNEQNELIGFSCRALRNEKQRYIVIKIKESPMIYNLNHIDRSQTIYVTEGPIDSLFLPNAIAVGNLNLKSAAEVLPKDNMVLIYDIQPRNKELIKEVEKSINDGHTVCLLPKSLSGKDINEIILNGMNIDELMSIISKYTFHGLTALLEFNKWRMV